MKITCQRQELSAAVANISRTVPPKSTVPALEGILLKAYKGILTLTAYNLELGISIDIEATVIRPGSIVLPARFFSDMLKKMVDGRVEIEVGEKNLTEIRCGMTEYTIPGINADDFPELPEVTDTEYFEIEQPVLYSMINQTIFATAVSELNPVHSGSLFELENGNITVVSVDGHRLAIRKEKIGGNTDISFVVPGKTLSEISKLLSADEKEMAEIKVANNKRHVVFMISGYTVISRLLEGEFHDYRSSIPSKSTTSITVSARSFAESIERVSLLITDRLKSPLRIVFGDNRAKLYCSTALGKAYDEEICQTEGDTVEIGFNNRYLLDALKASDCDELRLEMNGPLSPRKVMPKDGDSFLFLVLPVRLKAN